mgnify:CR=1 FL=1
MTLDGEPGANVSLNGRFDSFVDYVDSVLDAASRQKLAQVFRRIDRARSDQDRLARAKAPGGAPRARA